MTCQELVDFLMQYLDGELADDQASVFERHLVECPPCKVYLDTYEEAIRLGKRVCSEDEQTLDGAPEELITAILAARKGAAAG